MYQYKAEIWSKIKLVAVPKKGDFSLAKQHRRISLSVTASKIYNKMQNVTSKNKKRSTIVYTEYQISWQIPSKYRRRIILLESYHLTVIQSFSKYYLVYYRHNWPIPVYCVFTRLSYENYNHKLRGNWLCHCIKNEVFHYGFLQ